MTPGERYLRLEEEVIEYQSRRGIPYPITIVAVSKEASLEAIKSVYEVGCRDFGENRVNEWIQKKSDLPPDIAWHMIGQLQSGKLPQVVGGFSLIESVDSFELLKKIDERSQKAGIITSVLLQSNTSGEASKQGDSPLEWEKQWENCGLLTAVKIEGLMTIAPLTDDMEEIRKCFKSLRTLRDLLLNRTFPHAPLYHLSMGMSRDWRIALEEGATILRIGTTIFKI